jgi:AraC-like DNA-binding protein
MEDVRQGGFGSMRFSSADVPRIERAAILREVFGRGVCNMEFIPLTDAPEVDAELKSMPGLNVMWGYNSPHRMEIDPSLHDGGDMFMMSLFESDLQVRHKAGEIDIASGGALIVSTEQALTAQGASACRHVTLRLDYARLSRLVPDAEGSLLHVLPGERGALSLLKGYLELLRHTDVPLSAQAEHAVVTHIYDLVALAIGARRDVEELGGGRGVQAARLNAIRKHILSNLGDHRLSVQQVAAMQGVTTRYVQMLFESEGTTFSEFVLRERLAWTMRTLCDPASLSQTISTIALDAGFGDLSYFNRVFRRTYGETPSDARNRTIHAARH